MAGTPETINEIISPNSEKQVEGLKLQLVDLEKQFVDTAKAAIQLNNVTAGSGSFKDFSKNAASAQAATKTIVDNLEKQRFAEIRLQQAREKAFDDYERKLAKQQAAAEKAALADAKRKAKEQADSQRKEAQLAKEAAAQERAMAKEQAAIERAAQAAQRAQAPYQQLLARQRELNDAAQQAGASFGVASRQYQDAAARANQVNGQVAGINRGLGNYRDNVGNYAGGALDAFKKFYGYVRTAANILPAVGISTIFLAIGQALVFVAEKTGILDNKMTLLQQTIKNVALVQAALNDVQIKANGAVGTEIANLDTLYRLSQNRSLSIKDQAEAARELQATYPQTFENFTTEAIMAGKSSEAYKSLKDQILALAYAKAATDKIGQNSNRRLDDDIKISEEQRKQIGFQKTLADYSKKLNPNNTDYAYALQAQKDLEVSQKRVNDLKSDKLILNRQDAELERRIDQIAKERGVKNVTGNTDNEQKREADADAEFKRLELKREMDSSKAIFDNDKKSADERKKALSNYFEAENKLTELERDVKLKDIKLTNKERYNIEFEASSELLSNQREYIKELESINSNKKTGKSASEILNERLKAAQLANDAVQADQNKSDQQKIQSIYDFEKKSEDLILQAEHRKVLSVTEASNKSAEVEKSGNSQRLKILEDQQKRYRELREQALKELTDGEKLRLVEIQNAQNARIQIIESERRRYIDAISKQYAAGELTTRQYQNKLLAIEQASSLERINVQIDAAKKAIETNAAAFALGFGNPNDLQKSMDDLVKIQTDASDQVAKIQIENINKIIEARKNLQSIEQQLANKSVEVIQQLIDKGYKNQLNALQDQSDQLDSNSRVEKDAIDRSLDTQSHKADKQKLLDAQVAANKEQLAQKEKQIQHEQAKIDAIVAAGKIAGEAAQTVFQLEGQAAVAKAQAAVLLSNPLTAVYAPIAAAAAIAIQAEVAGVIALAAASAASIVIPAFEKGGKTDGSAGGLVLWGEKGVEKAIEPSGKTYYSHDYPTLAKMPAGTIIVPHNELAQPMKMNNYVSNDFYNSSEIVNAVNSNTRALKKAIESQRAPQFNGWLNEVSAASKWSVYSQRINR